MHAPFPSPRILGRLTLPKWYPLFALPYTSSARHIPFNFSGVIQKPGSEAPTNGRGHSSCFLSLLFKAPFSPHGLQKLLCLYLKQLEETNESFWILIIIFCDGELNAQFCDRCLAPPINGGLGAGWYTTSKPSRTNQSLGREGLEKGAVAGQAL